MRKQLLPFAIAAALSASAQCPFDPTVTPDNLILCPNGSDVLSTQVYDSYQWYKEGSPIPGATGQTLPVDQFNDAGYSFSVSATLDGCTELSPAVLVDSWVFLLPYVINGGDEPSHMGPNGEMYFCVGDTLTFEMGQPYDTHITWYRNGQPIPNETGTTLNVTQSGTYTSSCAPSICPDFIQNLGVDIVVVFTEPTQPTIEFVGDQLCAEPPGNSYQWYYAPDEPAPDNTQCITPIANVYYVYVDYGDDCQVISEPYIGEGIGQATRPAFSLAPNPASTNVTITWPANARPEGTWTLVDMTGRSVRRGAFSSVGSIALDTRDLPAGRYLFRALDDASWAPVAVSVAR